MMVGKGIPMDPTASLMKIGVSDVLNFDMSTPSTLNQ